MNITIDSYDSLTPEQADSICRFVCTLVASTNKSIPVGTPVADAPPPTPEVTPGPPVAEKPEKPAKRKRRTKAQITADKRQAAEDKATLAAAKGSTGAAEAASPAAPAPAAEGSETPLAAPAVEVETPTAAEPVESPSVSPSEGLSAGDMKDIVVATLERLTASGDPNAPLTLVNNLAEVTGKKRIGEIDPEQFAVVALNLKNLEYTPEVVDPLG